MRRGWLLLLLLPLSLNAQLLRFGSDFPYAQQVGTQPIIQPFCVRAAPAQSGTLDFIIMFVAVGMGDVKYGIYNDNGNQPNQLLAQSAPVFVDATTGMSISGNLSAPLVGGNFYWLCGTADDMSIGTFVETAPGNGRAAVNSLFTFPVPFTPLGTAGTGPRDLNIFIAGFYDPNVVPPPPSAHSPIIGGGIL
jgi:hypothetical protein